MIIKGQWLRGVLSSVEEQYEELAETLERDLDDK